MAPPSDWEPLSIATLTLGAWSLNAILYSLHWQSRAYPGHLAWTALQCILALASLSCGAVRLAKSKGGASRHQTIVRLVTGVMGVLGGVAGTIVGSLLVVGEMTHGATQQPVVA